MDKLEQNKEIERWNVDSNSTEHVLEIVSNKMSPKQVKHIKETGFEAAFTNVPQA